MRLSVKGRDQSQFAVVGRVVCSNLGAGRELFRETRWQFDLHTRIVADIHALVVDGEHAKRDIAKPHVRKHCRETDRRNGSDFS